MTHLKDIERLRELDKARTQGEYIIDETYDQDGVLIYTGDYAIANKNFREYTYPPNELGKVILAFSQGDYDAEAFASYIDEDLRFMTSAPKMMQIINRQQEIIELAKDFLKGEVAFYVTASSVLADIAKLEAINE